MGSTESNEYRECFERILLNKAVIGVVGMGYVGLPLALTFIRESKMHVIGFDVDKVKCKMIKEGRSYLNHLNPRFIQEAIISQLLEATTDFARLEECDAIIICVPTPLTVNREPDTTFIEEACQQIALNLQKGQVVSLESTTWPGTTDTLVRGILEKQSGLVAGKDFSLCYSPEREDPGNKNYTTYNIPKVVAGLTPSCADIGRELYRKAVATVHLVSNLRTAETTKLYENVYRSVNIALVNEMKMICQRMNLDIWEVIRAASTKPFGFHPFYPGPGVGGHCIPLDPGYLAWKAREYDAPTRFIDLASEINATMPHYVVGRVATGLNRQGKSLKGSRILAIGVAYKPDINDARESPALKVIELLLEAEAVVEYVDPYIDEIKLHKAEGTIQSVKLSDDVLKQYDCGIILTNHSCFDYGQFSSCLSLIIDTRNVVPNMYNNVFSA